MQPTPNCTVSLYLLGFPGSAVVKDLPADAGDTGGTGAIPGLGRSPGGGNGNPLQYSCLDRGAWQAAIDEITKSWTRLNRLSTHAHTYLLTYHVR